MCEVNRVLHDVDFVLDSRIDINSGIGDKSAPR